MELSGDDLRRFAPRLSPVPPPVKPLLCLVEELVLLTLGSSRIRRHNVARIAACAHADGPGDYHAAVTALLDRGMLIHAGPLRSLAATTSAQIPARKDRVALIIGRPAPPEGVDAELLVLLAAARGLALSTAVEHMQAHARIESIGHLATIPLAVAALADELGTPSMSELAHRLLPATTEDLRNADFAGRSDLSAALTYGPGAWC